MARAHSGLSAAWFVFVSPQALSSASIRTLARHASMTQNKRATKCGQLRRELLTLFAIKILTQEVRFQLVRGRVMYERLHGASRHGRLCGCWFNADGSV
jgi:hypothetical protein